MMISFGHFRPMELELVKATLTPTSSNLMKEQVFYKMTLVYIRYGTQHLLTFTSQAYGMMILCNNFMNMLELQTIKCLLKIL